MSEIIVLLVYLFIELGFVFYCLKAKSEKGVYKHIILFELFIFLILFLFKIIQWSFRWKLLFSILFIQTVIYLLRYFKRIYLKRTKVIMVIKKSYIILTGLSRCLLLIVALIPAILFPQYDQIETSGDYAVETTSYTLTDTKRIESYSRDGVNRKVTIQFWYPKNKTINQKYPLVIFSHGSFGFRGSNYSTFMELARNGYVVCSIDHTYQSFYTKQADGKKIIANNNFLKDAISVQMNDYDNETIYKLTHEWLRLRTDDMNFVLNTIIENTKKDNAEDIYKLIDIDKIGVFGHSIGGATAAQIGRERNDIDAVIVLDGTMVGEIVDFKNGEDVLNSNSYPTPILNVYNEQHFMEALNNVSKYANMAMSTNAIDSRNVVFKGAGHLNFTDLPLFSPILAKKLGTGNIDKVYCIRSMNSVVLSYFNYYLKDEEKLNINSEY